MEKAFHDFAKERIADGPLTSQTGWKLVHGYGLRPDLLAVTQVWQMGTRQARFTVATKGAPEAIADLCHLGEADRAAVKQAVDAMATEGLRILGVAKAIHKGSRFQRRHATSPSCFLGSSVSPTPAAERARRP